MTQDKSELINDLMNTNNKTWDKYGYTSRPSGKKYIELVLNIALQVVYEYRIQDITSDIQDVLTNENYHTLNAAIDIVKHLHKYA